MLMIGVEVKILFPVKFGFEGTIVKFVHQQIDRRSAHRAPQNERTHFVGFARSEVDVGIFGAEYSAGSSNEIVVYELFRYIYDLYHHFVTIYLAEKRIREAYPHRRFLLNPAMGLPLLLLCIKAAWARESLYCGHRGRILPCLPAHEHHQEKGCAAPSAGMVAQHFVQFFVVRPCANEWTLGGEGYPHTERGHWVASGRLFAQVSGCGLPVLCNTLQSTATVAAQSSWVGLHAAFLH